MVKTTSAERMRKLRSKLKEDKEKNERFKEKEKTRDRKRRAEMKVKRIASARLLREFRNKETIRKRVYRQKIKSSAVTDTPTTSVLGSFKIPQSLGKAVTKVKKMLPFSPSKKKAVLRKLISDTFPKLSKTLFKETEDGKKKHAMSEETVKKVKDFYNSDEISRQAPGIRDFKSVKDPKTGKRTKVQTRHMNMTVKEALAVFKEENPTVMVKSSKFYELRPENIKLASEMPHQVCVCKYHANFNFLIESVHKKDTSFPSDHAKLLENVCCDLSNESCMTGDCNKCVLNLHFLIDEEVDQSVEVLWKQWKDDECNRPKVVETKGTLSEAVEELQTQLATFKKHFFVKRLQAKTFKDLRSCVEEGEVILQIDYAENYLAVSQDEIQSAHWNHKQISVFTACGWTKTDDVLSMVVVSDETSHTKYSVYACLKLIIEFLKSKIPNLDTIKIFSDGCAGQFKSRYTISNLCHMMKDFGVKGEWFFFATSHGKGAVDGIGGITKRAVWNQVKLRTVLIESAKGFVECVRGLLPSVHYFLLQPSDIEENREMLDKRWQLVNKIPAIQSKHYFAGYDAKTLVCGRTFLQSELSKVAIFNPRPSVYHEIYGSDEETSEDEVPEKAVDDLLEPAVSLIQPGSFLLVRFDLVRGRKVNKYRHVAIAESTVEEDGDIKIVCLRCVGDTGKTFKVDRKDISYIQFEQVVNILPQPKLKCMRNNVAFYEFDNTVDIYESG